MRSTLSSRAIQSIHGERTDEVWVVLLQVDHPDLTQAIRICTNNETVTSGGFDYLALPFEIELPGQDPDSPGRSRIKIDNMDPVIVDWLRSISSPPTVTLRVVLASQPNTIELEFSGLVLRNCEYDASIVSADLNFESILVEPAALAMTPSLFPALF